MSDFQSVVHSGLELRRFTAIASCVSFTNPAVKWQQLRYGLYLQSVVGHLGPRLVSTAVGKTLETTVQRGTCEVISNTKDHCAGGRRSHEYLLLQPRLKFAWAAAALTASMWGTKDRGGFSLPQEKTEQSPSWHRSSDVPPHLALRRWG
jgi:hypothetical protein